MRKLKIVSPLLVENRNHTELLREIIEDRGHELVFLPDPLKITAVAEIQPDLVFLEPSLFHWQWLTVLLTLRQNHPEMPVILYSSGLTAENGFAPLNDAEVIYLSNDADCLAANFQRVVDGLITAKKKILFVDDDENILKSYRRMLRNSNWHILLASSGASALEQIRNDTVDLVVTDIKMPSMHGVELITRIRKTRDDLPIVVSSGYRGMREDASLKFHQIAAFIEKPIDPDDLQRTLLMLLK